MPMSYQEEVFIDLPRERVIELFEDVDALPKWQEGLVRFEHATGEPGQPGATSRIRYKMGNREIDMVETIVDRQMPDRFDATYEAGKVWNLVKNTFEDHGQRTRWIVWTEFRCGGFMRIMTTLFPGMFRKQTRKFMEDFKKFAEREGAGAEPVPS